ncbi:Charged multivesicular body protein 2A [Sparganum proliferum]
MKALFGKKKTPQEQLRENTRALNRVIRELDRESQRLDNEQVKTDAVKIMAKNLAVSLNMQTLKSTAAMADAMKQTTRTLVRMNKQMNLPELQKILMEFEKQSGMMEMKEEMISDAMDDVFEEEGDAEASDAVVRQILDELGLEMAGAVNRLPTSPDSIGAPASGVRATNQPVPATGGPDGPSTNDENDLEERLNRLKRG